MNLYLENAKMLLDWGFDISYMIGVVISQEEYDTVTKKPSNDGFFNNYVSTV